MERAAHYLIGTHDFATFGQPPQGTNTVRELLEAKCYREDRFVYFEVKAKRNLSSGSELEHLVEMQVDKRVDIRVDIRDSKLGNAERS